MTIITDLTQLITKPVITDLIKGAKFSHGVLLTRIYIVLSYKINKSMSSCKSRMSNADIALMEKDFEKIEQMISTTKIDEVSPWRELCT
ncbi:hypothetical protein CTAM01_02766 [Colletotrichum tamarilloi]|uniref:Uncharacterized protein n=1 Tax=Colletotrichum tamarilloi TaxID=1209934 RepID=A0ABQ9RMC9_9PEZI|nr:uncharacterized protein CTAM01_02766 [Colletotrichum tamarilloi]KAK1507654.1 hypothetical protein CTAM01_02766 [Colletotrichum tamarilloi]